MILVRVRVLNRNVMIKAEDEIVKIGLHLPDMLVWASEEVVSLLRRYVIILLRCCLTFGAVVYHLRCSVILLGRILNSELIHVGCRGLEWGTVICCSNNFSADPIKAKALFFHNLLVFLCILVVNTDRGRLGHISSFEASFLLLFCWINLLSSWLESTLSNQHLSTVRATTIPLLLVMEEVLVLAEHFRTFDCLFFLGQLEPVDRSAL